MTILWMNFFIVFILAFFARYFAMPVTSEIVMLKPNRLLILMATTSLVLVSGFRNNIGDTYFYMHAFTVTDFNWAYIQSSKDVGFSILQMILKHIRMIRKFWFYNSSNNKYINSSSSI